MRIAIDARLNAYRQGGIPQYTRQLITALADIATDDQIVSFQHRDQLRPLAIAPNVVRRTALTPPHHRFERWALPVEVLLARPDVLHCPDFIAPTLRSCPAVVTIHDLAFMHYPEILDASARAYYSQVIANAPRADAIIAVSESTRQDIAQFLDIPIEQIDVIYEAAAPLYTKLQLREGEARVLNSTPVAAGTFMLFVSTLEPRKNLPTLLQALRICIDRRPEANYQLVIVGRRGWRDEAIFQTARDLKLADHVLFTGGVGQYDLRWLYNACRLYINPSLYEGFGLPLLEAMACGAPCLAAATSSLPEIGGEAAIYVPPLEAEQWADEIMALWDDEERRAELGRVGMARAQQFSWHRAARETLKVYRRAADRIVPRAEPLAPSRYTLPAEPVPAISLAALDPDAPRPCLRCGTALLPGDLQIGVSARSADTEQGGTRMAPRIWSCPRCGYVELVNETHHATTYEHALADVDLPVQSSDLAVAPEAGGVASEAVADAPGTLPAEPELPEAPVEHQPAADIASAETELDQEPAEVPTWPEETPDDELADAPAVLADEAAVGSSLAEIDLDDDRSNVPVETEQDEELADTPAALADQPDISSVLAEAEPGDDLVDAPAVLADEPVANAAPAGDQGLEELAALEAGADANASEQEQAELPVLIMPDMPTQRSSADGEHTTAAPELPPSAEGSAPGMVAGDARATHSPKSPNGSVIKSRSGRGSRRQQSGGEPAGKTSAKSRSSGSKRKQTT